MSIFEHRKKLLNLSTLLSSCCWWRRRRRKGLTNAPLFPPAWCQGPSSRDINGSLLSTFSVCHLPIPSNSPRPSLLATLHYGFSLLFSYCLLSTHVLLLIVSPLFSTPSLKKYVSLLLLASLALSFFLNIYPDCYPFSKIFSLLFLFP